MDFYGPLNFDLKVLSISLNVSNGLRMKIIMEISLMVDIVTRK